MAGKESHSDSDILRKHGVDLVKSELGLGVYKIPSDDEGIARLSVQSVYDDAFLKAEVYDGKTFFESEMRFRSHRGGGGIWQLSSQLLRIPTAFHKYHGQKVDETNYFTEPVVIPSRWDLEIQKNSDNKIPILVKNIPDDDGRETYMDIEIDTNEDVILTFRNPELDDISSSNIEFIGKTKMVFKKKDSKFPVMNKLLSEIAIAIAKGEVRE